MILSMSNQAWMFLFTVALGFVIGFIYDIFRILRRSFKHPDFLTQIEDFIYWIVASGLVFYFILNRNDGEIRLFYIMGAFMGMLVYFFTLSFLVVKLSVAVINFIKKVISTIITITLFPIRLLFRLILFPVKLLGRLLSPLFGSAKKTTKNALQKSGRYAKMRASKTIGDLRIIFKKV